MIAALSILHPDTNSFLGGVATVTLYIAVLAPIFWVPRIRVSLSTLRLAFLLFWAFNTAGALAGMLQVYFPGRFQPPLATGMEDDYLNVEFRLANGAEVFRPMGLTNNPGGAAPAGAYTLFFAIALLLDRPRYWFRAVLVASMVVGVFATYLSQIRSVVVMTGIGLLALAVPSVAQRRITRFASIVILSSLVAVFGFLVAASIGGDVITDRLATLTENDPVTVYNENRGFFLRQTFTELLPTYPLGAGLGRYGILSAYFRDPLSSPPVWAEIQWTGWLYDGGLPMVLMGLGGLVVALWTLLRVASRSGDPAAETLQHWATVIFGYSVGISALTFSSIQFQSNAGMDFWLFNAMIFAASEQAKRLPETLAEHRSNQVKPT